jgi:hypothetical protein
MTLFFKNFDKGEARKSLAGDGPAGNSPEENECYFPDLNIKVGNELIKLDSYECYIPGLTIKTEDGVSKTLYSCINLHLGDLQLGAGINLAYSIGEVDTVLWEKTYKLASDFIGDIVALTSKKGDFTPEILKKMGFTPYSTVK